MTHSGALPHERDTVDGEHLDETPALRESGIPPTHLRPTYEHLADKTAECIESALAESARTEANLNLLLRGLEQIVAGASASRDSNSMLSRELDNLRDALARSSAEEMALRQRVRLLELAVDRARRDATLERAFFLEQEDAFLAELLTDHEREVAALRRRLMEALTRTPTPSLVPAPSGTRQSGSQPIFRGAPDTVRPSSGEVAVVRLGTVKIPRPAPSDEDRPTPVSNPSIALSPPSSPSSSSSGKIPAVVQKPDIASRPLVGYSLREGEVAEERVETPASSRPE